MFASLHTTGRVLGQPRLNVWWNWVGYSHRVVGEGREGFSPSLNSHEYSVFSQILAYKDDFKSERADRERAHSRIQELEEKIMSLMYQVSQRQDSREPGPCRIHTGNKTAKYLEMDALEHVTPGGWRPESRSQQMEPSAEGGHVCTAQRGQGDLQCPHCLRCFSDEQGEAFLRHLSECCQ